MTKDNLKVSRVILALFLGLLCSVALAEPMHVYLTWQHETSRTMTVNYHTAKEAETSLVYYDTDPHGYDTAKYRWSAQGAGHQIEGLPDGRWIHTVELTGLEPAGTYHFIAGDPKNGFTAVRKFRTLPDGQQPIRFITGGDMYMGDRPNALQRLAAKENPDFALIGGDIAYVNGVLADYAKWDRWLTAWETLMVTPDGATIPMILAIGNHETNSKETVPERRAPFYFGYFAQSDKTYFARRIGAQTVLFALDTGHVAPHGGEQAAWLESEMEAYADVPNKFACYHVPLYPSHREYEGSGSKAGREAWLPIFDKHGLDTAFENHDHTYKRSKLLKNNEVHPQGTLYLGDGCFGQGPRTVDKEIRWYLENQGSIAHFWTVDITPIGIVYQAIDENGFVFDAYSSVGRNLSAAELRQ